jgi:choline kinase
MQVVIMAAGLGNRLGELTRDRPKALVPAAGRELILRALDFVDHPRVTERIVVTGFAGERLAAFLSARAPDVHMIHNPDFRDGSIRTLEAVLPSITGEFLLMNVDHIYPRRMFPHILSNARGITAICDFDRTLGPDDMKVKLAADRRLTGIRKTLEDFDGGYIGMTFCSASALPLYREHVAKARRFEGDAASAEAALASLAADGADIEICDAGGFGWLEVDTPDELARAEGILLQNPGFTS